MQLRVESRLHSNLIAWLTTVRPDGQPVTVPAWFLLRDDGTILLYSKPEQAKLRTIVHNPKVSVVLDAVGPATCGQSARSPAGRS